MNRPLQNFSAKPFGAGGRLGLFATAVIAAAMLLLGGCGDQRPAPRVQPDMTWGHMGVFRLQVATVDVVNEYVPSFAPPSVEHLMALTPAEAAERWARERLTPAGVGGRARFIIKEARIIETALESGGGLKQYFTNEQSERYDGRLHVVLEILGPDGGHGRIEATATGLQTVAEDATLFEREQAWFLLTENMMRELDASLAQGIHQHFKPFLAASPAFP